MKIRPSLLLVATVAVVSATGCTVASSDTHDEEALGSAQQAVGPGGWNGKRGRCTWHIASRQAYRNLANAALNAGSGNLPSLSLLSDCRDEVIANAVECALTDSQVVRDPVTGHLFRGWWGLAPSWYSQPLGTSQRRFVTACMVQRLNAFGATVPILLEGASPPINANPTLEASYPFEESIAYGDLFTPPATSIGVVNVCYNDDLESACHANGTTAVDWLKLRICDSSPSCGLNITGRCSQVCSPSGINGYPACKRSDGTSDDHTVEVRLQTADACGG